MEAIVAQAGSARPIDRIAYLIGRDRVDPVAIEAKRVGDRFRQLIS
jgi:hypothetical protein